MPSKKALALGQELFDELKKRLSALAFVEGFDANGDYTISIGAGTAGSKSIVVRVKPVSTGAKDVLGLTQDPYTPTVVQFATEKNFEGTTDNVLDILTPTELLPFFVAVARRSTRVEWYRSTNGTAPTVSTMDSASNLAAATEANLYWGALASQ